MDEVLVQVVAGISRGGLYFLISAGLTLTLGALNVINLAHGSFYMVGAYVTALLIETYGTGTGFLLAWFVAPLVVVALAVLIEFTVMRRTYLRGHFVQLLATFAVLLIIDDLVRSFFGTDPRTAGRVDFLSGSVNAFGLPVAKYNFFVVGVSGVIAIVLFLVLNKSMWGRRIRASVDDPEMVSASGMNLKTLRLGLFTLGAGLAGIAGVVVAPSAAVQPGMDVEIIITAFAVTIIGGLGSVSGALAGAMIVGVVESLGVLYIERGSIAIIFVIMALVLAFRPTGLFGREEASH